MSQTDDSMSISGFERRFIAVLKGCHYAGMACIAAMTLLTVIHGVGRYALGKPVPGLLDLSSYLLVLSVFLLGAYTMVVKGHIAVGIVVDRFPRIPRIIFESLAYIFCLVVASFALWQAVVRGNYMLEVMQSSPVLQIPNFPFVYFVAFGWGIFGLAVIMHLVNLFVYRQVEK